MKLCSLVPNSYILVSVGDLYIPRISLIGCKKKADRSWEDINRSQIYECGYWETEHCNSVLEITRPWKFHFWEYINRNQTFILDSHRPFIWRVEYCLCDIPDCINRFFWHDLRQIARNLWTEVQDIFMVTLCPITVLTEVYWYFSLFKGNVYQIEIVWQWCLSCSWYWWLPLWRWLPYFNPFLFLRGLSCPRCDKASLSLNCIKLTLPGFPTSSFLYLVVT